MKNASILWWPSGLIYYLNVIVAITFKYYIKDEHHICSVQDIQVKYNAGPISVYMRMRHMTGQLRFCHSKHIIAPHGDG